MVRFYLDEDCTQHRLTAALRSHSLDVATSLDSGMNASDDASQLSFAAAQGRVLVSHNARDFGSLHCDWLERGRSHCGILILPQQRYSTGETVRRMLRLASSGYLLRSRIYYLSNF